MRIFFSIACTICIRVTFFLQASISTGDTTTVVPGASPTATTAVEEELMEQKQKRVEVKVTETMTCRISTFKISVT